MDIAKVVEEAQKMKAREEAEKAEAQKWLAAETLSEKLAAAEKVLVGLGREWSMTEAGDPDGLQAAYHKLAVMLAGKDYFLVTTCTDAAVYQMGLDPARITAPCGNDTWRQCSESCTKDIWEPGEIPDDICPHCGAPLTGNTIRAKLYIEEGYKPQWLCYTAWLGHTVNRRLLVLELGVDFQTPTVIRWPFEKNVMFNQQSFMIRVNAKYAQLTPEIRERARSVGENSPDWIRKQEA